MFFNPGQDTEFPFHDNLFILWGNISSQSVQKAPKTQPWQTVWWISGPPPDNGDVGHFENQALGCRGGKDGIGRSAAG